MISFPSLLWWHKAPSCVSLQAHQSARSAGLGLLQATARLSREDLARKPEAVDRLVECRAVRAHVDEPTSQQQALELNSQEPMGKGKSTRAVLT